MDLERFQKICKEEPVPSHILEKYEYYKKRKQKMPGLHLLKRPTMIEGIRKASWINKLVLDEVEKNIRVGMSTQEIDDIVKETTDKYGGICADYGFEGFPKHVCTSINDVVCHGIPSRLKKLQDGDIINVDCTTIIDGYYGDASRMFCVGNVSEKRKRLVQVTKECLEAGLAAAKPWGYFGDIGHAIYTHARKNGYSVVKELGGHGVGCDFHEDPFVYHFGQKNTGMMIVPGMVFTIEPMINEGLAAIEIDPYDGWTITTQDHRDSAQWEYTILITEDGHEVLSY